MAARKPTHKGATGTFVMMIGDEGAVLVQLVKGAVVRRLFAQSADTVHVRGFEEVLDSAPNSPIIVLFDMMDQSYVRQTLPPVSSFSIGKIITRRLTKDFAPEDIKGYIILDREKTGRKDWNYMMVSLASNAILQKWVNFVVERPNPFQGMGLLPLESQRLIQTLEKTYLQQKEKGDRSLEWQILVSHNKVGGFRQIVMRDGKLVFTRMAQPFGESTPDVIAGNIEQEMINTFEYLKRFGLPDPSKISITIICAEDIKKSLDPKNIKTGEHHFLTPYDVAQLLALKGAAQPEDSFGDVVVSAFIAKRRKLLLPLNTTYTKKLSTLYTVIKGIKLAGVLAALAAVAWMGMSTSAIVTTKHALDDLETKHRRLMDDLNRIKSRAATLPKNAAGYSDIMTLSEAFDKSQYDTLSFIESLANGVRNKALLTSLHWSISNTLNATKTSDTRQITAELELHLTQGQETAAKMASDIKQLVDSIKSSLPDFNISNPDTPGLQSENTDIKTIINENNANPAASSGDTAALQNALLKITISGPGKTAPPTRAR